VAKLGAASDLSPSGILTATVAAAKLTGLGVKIAGKKMGRMGKGKRLSTATNFIGAAARLTGDDDGGGDFEDDDGEEGDMGGLEDTEEVDEPVTAETAEPGVVDPNEPAAFAGYPPQPPQQEVYFYTEQQPYYYPQPAVMSPEPVVTEYPAHPPPPMGEVDNSALTDGAPIIEASAVPPPLDAYAGFQTSIYGPEQLQYYSEQPAYQYPATVCETPGQIPPQEPISADEQPPPPPVAGEPLPNPDQQNDRNQTGQMYAQSSSLEPASKQPLMAVNTIDVTVVDGGITVSAGNAEYTESGGAVEISRDTQVTGYAQLAAV